MQVSWEDRIEAFALAMAMAWFCDRLFMFAQLGDLPE
jgi:hypothetical protein